MTDEPGAAVEPGPRARAALVAAGAATLFVELTLIRYVPGQVRVLGYFTNFVLLAAFLGFGVGMLAARRWPSAAWLSAVAPLALLAVVGLTELGTRLQVLPSSEQFLFLEYRERGTPIPLYPFLAGSFVLLAGSFVPLGHVVGNTLSGGRPLLRYGLNVVGSLVGIGAFVAMSAAGAAPWLWMAVAAGFTSVGVVGASPRWRGVAALAMVATTAVAWNATRGATWSPYQKITVGPIHLHPELGVVQEWRLPTLTPKQKAELTRLPREEGFTVRVNDDSYQTPLDLSPAAVARHPELTKLAQQYDLPFVLRKFRGSVLVLGAGTGNDVAGALRGGATDVDAVEIDPEILALGARHPERPYADPRVRVYLDDARSFLARSGKQYDMIVFGLVDSHVLLSSKSNVRLDSFVFTRESFELARARLAPEGVLLVSHAVGTPWFLERMKATLGAAFGKPPLVLTGKFAHALGIVYAAGETVRPGDAPRGHPTVLEDDWPFVYLKAPAIPGEYLIAMLLMALASLGAVRAVAGSRWQGLDLHFFALGAGFLLLETRGLGVLALHLGSTWSVNAAVFAGVLMMALLATIVGARLARSDRRRVPWVAYGVLGALLVANFAIPQSTLAALPLWARIAGGVALVSVPLFASGIVFALSLARTGGAERALASNLVGAMAGGLVEYSSMVVGFRALVLLATAFYLGALLADVRARAAV